MIMTYIKFVAALVMLAHPVAYDVDRGHVGDAVAVTWSPTSPSRPAPGSEKAQIHRATAIRADESKTAFSARAAKQAKPNSSDLPPARIADLQPAAKTTADPGSAEASSAVSPPAKAATADSDFNAGTTQQQVTAATAASIDADHLVAILMTRPEIKSVSDLAGKTVAIDGRQFNGNVRPRSRPRERPPSN
jgi:hypothetical protein